MIYESSLPVSLSTLQIQTHFQATSETVNCFRSRIDKFWQCNNLKYYFQAENLNWNWTMKYNGSL